MTTYVETNRLRSRTRWQSRVQQGLCGNCGELRDGKSTHRCVACSVDHRLNQAAKRTGKMGAVGHEWAFIRTNDDGVKISHCMHCKCVQWKSIEKTVYDDLQGNVLVAPEIHTCPPKSPL